MTLECPTAIGPYRVLEILGEGGMGTVYLAEQREPVERRVALKVVKLGLDTKQVLGRFETERQALALMNHPNIARVLDAGATAQKQPYFVMELVRGLPITDYCDKHLLGLSARVQLFRQVCLGVQHAHHKGVIHRDLKPSNILVEEQDGRPVAKIIDFGLAKATDRRLTAQTFFTAHDQPIGTPEYMSPEQAEMSGLDVDTRTDVYSLGVLLYQLLTGELPFSTAELQRAGVLEVQRKIREDAPPKPSTRVSTLGDASAARALHRGVSLHALLKELRGDLDWVVMKALEKDRGRRYQTPTELGQDLERYLAQEPVSAGPPSLGYRLAKFVRKNRAQVVAAGIVMSAMLGIAGAVVWGYVTTNRAYAQTMAVLKELDSLTAALSVEELTVEVQEDLWPLAPSTVPRVMSWFDRARSILQQRDQLAVILGSKGSGVKVIGEDSSLLGERYAHLERARSRLQENLDVLPALMDEVGARLKRIHDIEAMSGGSDSDARWEDAIASIAKSGAYRHLRIVKQSGLIPLGINKSTGLWSFFHVSSGDRPTRNRATGGVRHDVRDGIVLVLLPGGRVSLGSTSDSEKLYRSSLATGNEASSAKVVIEPFFIGVCEVTQGQWKRLSENGVNPSAFNSETARGGVTSELHPVEMVDWFACQRTLWHHGLTLPNEAQWEYACRGGEPTPWWCGANARDVEAIDGMCAANIADASAFRVGIPLVQPFDDEKPPHDDGFPVHAPVASTRPNGFGLFDTLGNVWEWTLDPWADKPGSPLPPGYDHRPELWPRATEHAQRGGSWRSTAADARCGFRLKMKATITTDCSGLRAARLLERP